MAKKDEFATALLICLTEKLIDTYGKKGSDYNRRSYKTCKKTNMLSAKKTVRTKFMHLRLKDLVKIKRSDAMQEVRCKNNA